MKQMSPHERDRAAWAEHNDAHRHDEPALLDLSLDALRARIALLRQELDRALLGLMVLREDVRQEQQRIDAMEAELAVAEADLRAAEGRTQP